MTSASPRRRSARLASCNQNIDKDCAEQHMVPVSLRRSTGQLRLPTPSSAASRFGARKGKKYGRSPESGKKSLKRGRRGRLSKIANCHTSGLVESTGSSERCIFCSPESSPERCAHNRGTTFVPESAVSSFSPDIVLASVETESNEKSGHQSKGSIWTESPISPQEQRDLEQIMEILDNFATSPRGDALHDYIADMDPDNCTYKHTDIQPPKLDAMWKKGTVECPQSPTPSPQDALMHTCKAGDQDGMALHLAHSADTEPKHSGTYAESQFQDGTRKEEDDNKTATPIQTFLTVKTAFFLHDMTRRSYTHAREWSAQTNWAIQYYDPITPGTIAPPSSPDCKSRDAADMDIAPLII